MTANGKLYNMSNGKTFAHAGKMHPTALSIFLKTVTDVLIFLGVSIGFIVQVSIDAFSSWSLILRDVFFIRLRTLPCLY